MVGTKSKSDDQYSPEETHQRMIAALRGARLAGHMPMKAKVKKAAKKAKKAKRAKSKKLT
jgi:hypothetical protein